MILSEYIAEVIKNCPDTEIEFDILVNPTIDGEIVVCNDGVNRIRFKYYFNYTGN